MRKIIRACGLLAFFGCSFEASAACDSFRDDVLVIVNANSRTSAEIGSYYAAQRCVSSTNIATVHTPPYYNLDWPQYQLLVNELAGFLLNRIAASGISVPNSLCAGGGNYCAESVAFIRMHTGIRYLVTTRGVPSRITNIPNSSSGGSTTSLDDYLRYSMVRYITSEPDYQNNSQSTVRVEDLKQAYRGVNPVTDGELLIGRVDGLSATAAKNLVDRAITAEQQGIYGHPVLDISKTSQAVFSFGATWKYSGIDIGSSTNYFNAPINNFRYYNGIFGEQNSICNGANGSAYYLFGPTPSAETPPAQCVVQFSDRDTGTFGYKTNKAGFTGSSLQVVNDALLYMGQTDGQPSYWSVPTTGTETQDDSSAFRNFLHWRRAGQNSSCQLCSETSDPSVCAAQSTDVFKEVDTRCAGVANGFIGFNFQSYPVAYFGAWPTGWRQSYPLGDWNPIAGGDTPYMLVPEVRTDDGASDSYSLYFGNTDSVEQPQCFNGVTSAGSCVPNKMHMSMEQRINVAPFHYVPGGQQYTLNFKYKYKAVAGRTPPVLYLKVYLRQAGTDQGYSAPTPGYAQLTSSSLSDTAGQWRTLTYQYTHQAETAVYEWYATNGTLQGTPHTIPSGGSYSDIVYNGVKLLLLSDASAPFAGELSLDDFSLTLDGQPVTLINPSFNQGHLQSSTGDHAAQFLNRLNGTAFFGSMTHHILGGWSFARNYDTSMVHFFRGLPLSDSVWQGKQGSGMLYGDPLYNPVAVRLNGLTQTSLSPSRASVIWKGPLALQGNVRNGYQADTHFTIDYCSSQDFFYCDVAQSWINLKQGNGIRNGLIDTIDTTALSGLVTLRLSATTTYAGRTQTFNDYLLLQAIAHSGDDDADGVDNDHELFFGYDPLDIEDTDQDGLADEWEITNFRTGAEAAVDQNAFASGATNPCSETCVAARLARGSRLDDYDGDGFSNYLEYKRGNDQVLRNYYVNSSAATGGNGTQAYPFTTIDQAKQAGLKTADTLYLAAGTYTLSNIEGINIVGAGPTTILSGSSLPAYTNISKAALANASSMTLCGNRFDQVSLNGGILLQSFGNNACGTTTWRNVLITNSSLLFWGMNFIDIENSTIYRADPTTAAIDFLDFSSTADVANALAAGTRLRLKNSIVQGRIFLGGTSIAGAVPNAPVSISYNLLSGGLYQGQNHNFSADPLFVAPTSAAGGNYHLRPLSPAIDAGDPTTPFANERSPRGRAINLGRYGNTSEAQFVSKPVFIQIIMTSD